MSGARDLTRYAWLSIAAALATITLKAVAYLFTGSVGLLSDALESVVNLVAAVVALWALRVAAAPPDAGHPYGHDKAELFSSGVEGALIFAAAAAIIGTAVPRLFTPRPLEDLGIGLGVSVVASIVNLVVSRILVRAGTRLQSIALEADGHHLMTDVVTSAGVIVGVGLVEVTGILLLDPLVAIGVALHILWVGFNLVRRSVHGLMDPALPPAEQAAIEQVLDGFRADGATWHGLRTRQAGARRFVAVHVLVPGAWPLHRAHDLAERIEVRIRTELAGTDVVIHLEPIEDARAWTDQGPGDRAAGGPPPAPTR